MSTEAQAASAAENQSKIDFKFISQEMAVFGAATVSAYSQMVYHITRFARTSLTDLPFGKFMERHSGNIGPSTDLAIWPTLFGEVVKTIGETYQNKLLIEIGDKLIPILTIASIAWINFWSEGIIHPNLEGNTDAWTGTLFAGLSIFAIKGIGNRIRNAPHKLKKK